MAWCTAGTSGSPVQMSALKYRQGSAGAPLLDGANTCVSCNDVKNLRTAGGPGASTGPGAQPLMDPLDLNRAMAMSLAVVAIGVQLLSHMQPLPRSLSTS